MKNLILLLFSLTIITACSEDTINAPDTIANTSWSKAFNSQEINNMGVNSMFKSASLSYMYITFKFHNNNTLNVEVSGNTNYGNTYNSINGEYKYNSKKGEIIITLKTTMYGDAYTIGKIDGNIMTIDDEYKFHKDY